MVRLVALQSNGDLLRFVKGMIAFRKANPALRQPEFLTGRTASAAAIPISHGTAFSLGSQTGVSPSRSIAFMLCGRHGAAVGGPSHFIYCAFNMYFEPLDFTLPVLPKG